MLLHASTKNKKDNAINRLSIAMLSMVKNIVTFDDVFACNSILFVIYLL